MSNFDFDTFMLEISESSAQRDIIYFQDSDLTVFHGHFFTNSPESEPYRPKFLLGINADYLKQLTRILSEKPVIFTTKSQSNKIVKGRGDRAMVKNTGPCDLHNLSEISVVPVLTRKYLVETTEGEPLLQTVDSRTFENNIWCFLAFARGVVSIIDSLTSPNFDIYSLNDAFWGVVYNQFSKLKNDKNLIALEIDLALQNSLPTDTLSSRMMKLVKFLQDNWFPSATDLSILGAPVHFSKENQELFSIGLAKSPSVGELNETTVDTCRQFLDKSNLMQREDYQPYLDEVDEKLNLISSFNVLLKKIVTAIRFFELTPIAKICAAHNSQIKRGEEMDVILL